MTMTLFNLSSIRVTPLFLLGTAVALVLALNALLLLLAPQQLSTLPRWLRAPGSLIQHGYRNRPSTTEIRLSGLIVLVLLSWVIYDMLSRPR